MRLFWERVLRFGCDKPGGRPLSPSTAQALMAKDKDSVCVVKSKDGNRTLYYRRRGIVEKVESEEKKEKAEQRLARQEKALEKTKAGTKKAGVLQGRVERQRERLKQAIERLRQDTERYTRAKKLLQEIQEAFGLSRHGVKMLPKPSEVSIQEEVAEKALPEGYQDKLSYVKLVGSEKQKSWANDIRHRVFDFFKEDKVKWWIARRELSQVSSASWWIDQRLKSSQEIGEWAEKEAKKKEGLEKGAAEKKKEEVAKKEVDRKKFDEEISKVIPAIKEYQKEGAFRLRNESKVLLADEQGLGKTMQVIAAAQGQKWPIVIVTPATLKLKWRDEFEKWLPGEYKINVQYGKDQPLKLPAPGEVTILNYDILSETTEGELPAGLTVVYDEVQNIKGYAKKVKRVSNSKKLSGLANRVFALTGTPMMNKPLDLWGVLENTGMASRVWGNWDSFMGDFGGRKNQWGGLEFTKVSEDVPKKLSRVMVRRLRRDVLPEIPDKTYDEVTVDISAMSATLRNQMDEAWKKIDLASDELPSFKEMSSIRASLAKSRIPNMLELVKQSEESEEPLLVFSSHTSPINELKKRDGWAVITGETPSDDRNQIEKDFQDGKLKGVGISIKAGGTGLTLTRAHHALFVDLDWTPAANAQAEDRIARIGQVSKKILITRLVSDHALDKHIQNLLVKKIAMSEKALGDVRAT